MLANTHLARSSRLRDRSTPVDSGAVRQGAVPQPKTAAPPLVTQSATDGLSLVRLAR